MIYLIFFSFPGSGMDVGEARNGGRGWWILFETVARGGSPTMRILVVNER